MIDRIMFTVDVSDDRKFQDVVLLIDRQDFQAEFSNYKSLIFRESQENVGLFDLLTKTTWFDKSRELVQKYKYPLGFTKAIRSLALTNKIVDDDVMNCYSTILMHPFSDNDSYTVTLTKKDLVFFVDPISVHRRKKSIETEFSEILSTIPATVSLPSIHPLNLDIKPEIRLQRELFWERKSLKTSTKDLIEKYFPPNTPENTVNKKISEYGKLLKVKFNNSPTVHF